MKLDFSDPNTRGYFSLNLLAQIQRALGLLASGQPTCQPSHQALQHLQKHFMCLTVVNWLSFPVTAAGTAPVSHRTSLKAKNAILN